MLTIRDADATDVPLLLTLVRALADYEQLAHEVVATEKKLEEALFGSSAHARALLAESDGIAAGFAVYFLNFSTFLARPGLYLEDLFVLPERRGQGMGQALLVELARRARAQDCGRMEGSVLESNEPAIRFYERLGARRLRDSRTFRLTESAIAAVAEWSPRE